MIAEHMALEGLHGQQVRVYFAGGGWATGVLSMANKTGAMLEPCEHGLARRHPETDTEPIGFFPWVQIKAITLGPDRDPVWSKISQ